MRRFLLLPLAVVLAGCPLDVGGGPGDPVVCTMIFAAVTLDARDDEGAPVAADSVSVRRADGQQLVCPASAPEDASGCVRPFVVSNADRTRFAVVHDGIALSRTGETLRVTASDGRRSGRADVVVGHDGCHVEMVSGPSEIVLR